MKIKICGITHPDDAEYAARLGADYIGMIFAKQSKRKISLSMAKNIAELTKDIGAEPVGVFVEHTVDQIAAICEETGINTVQLHGTTSKQSLDLLLKKYSVIYALSVKKNGIPHETQSLPDSVIRLYDHSGGGTGMAFDWKAFSLPKNTLWMLAGGLTPENVAEAINLLHPWGVDVATGVEFPDMTRKNPFLVKAFIQTAKKIEEKT